MANTFHHGMKQQNELFGERWHWLWNEPKEWRRIYKHKKRRAELQRNIQRIVNGYDPDNEVFPLDKKPWIYYY